jgi:3'(2'), 5'-bisphosphate nucleotidase
VTDFDPGQPTAAELADDHLFAAWAATTAGRLLLDVRQQGLEGRQLKDAGDLASHELLMGLLAEYRPDDAILSEEEHRGTVGRHDRHTTERVWIIDPVDGTREYSEPPRDDWAVHVGLWDRNAGDAGDLVAGAVAQPGLGTTFHTGAAPVVPERDLARPRIVASRTRPPAFVHALVEHLGGELVPMGSAGAKVISVVRDVSDAYVHAGGQYEWDSAAPVAVARAAALHTSRVDGSPLVYNQADVQLPDLVVCRPELAEPILAFLARHGTD